MSLRDQAQWRRQPEPTVAPPAPAARADSYKALKGRIHLKLLEKFDLAALETLSPETLRQEIAAMVERLLPRSRPSSTTSSARTLIRDIQHETFGLGPLELLMADPTVSDILVNAPDQIYVERRGRLELTDVTLPRRAAPAADHRPDRLAGRPARRRNEPDGRRPPARRLPRQRDHPAAGARRAGAVDPPLRPHAAAHGGPGRRPQGAHAGDGAAARGRCARPGATSSSPAAPAPARRRCSTPCRGFIPDDERVVTIEDAAELQLQQPHVVRLETRPPNIEGKGEVTQRDLVRNALRMRPDRIIIGECAAPRRSTCCRP